MDENEQTTSTDEIDTEGGWLITHWTRTWDTRVPLTQLQTKRDEAQAKVDAAQAELAELDTKLTTFNDEVRAATEAVDVISEAAPANE